jgi:hypothetical protein
VTPKFNFATTTLGRPMSLMRCCRDRVSTSGGLVEDGNADVGVVSACGATSTTQQHAHHLAVRGVQQDRWERVEPERPMSAGSQGKAPMESPSRFRIVNGSAGRPLS